MDIQVWTKLLQEYGPLIGPLLGLVIWQAYQIRKLIEWNSRRHDEEIERMAEVQNRFLTHILGPQATSSDSPTLDELKKTLGPKREILDKTKSD